MQRGQLPGELIQQAIGELKLALRHALLLRAIAPEQPASIQIRSKPLIGLINGVGKQQVASFCREFVTCPLQQRIGLTTESSKSQEHLTRRAALRSAAPVMRPGVSGDVMRSMNGARISRLRAGSARRMRTRASPPTRGCSPPGARQPADEGAISTFSSSCARECVGVGADSQAPRRRCRSRARSDALMSMR